MSHPTAHLAASTADASGYFSRMLSGDVPPPPVATLLGGVVTQLDLQVGLLRARYTATDAFLNPAGTVQGGMLSAMLDDLTACLLDASLMAGEGVATLNLNVSFLRPAAVGELTGEARFIRRGRSVCHVSGVLQQDGKDVATAVATCQIVRTG
jgi:uncharacterized protein (TIGR00369 family)